MSRLIEPKGGLASPLLRYARLTYTFGKMPGRYLQDLAISRGCFRLSFLTIQDKICYLA